MIKKFRSQKSIFYTNFSGKFLVSLSSDRVSVAPQQNFEGGSEHF